jgi:hypothetical protein
MKKLFVLFIFSFSLCFAQSNFVFPFDTANRWDYYEYNAFSGFPIDKFSVWLGKDTLMPNNQIYKQFAMHYFRRDDSKIYQFSEYDSAEFIRYDFSKKIGDTVSFIRIGNDSSVVLLADDQYIPVFGQSRRVLRFNRWNGAVWDDIADSIGIIYFSDEIDFWYELKGAIISGKVYGDITSVSYKEGIIPNTPKLSQNYPNPFNPLTMMQYIIPHNSYVKIIITNIIGQQVAVLVDSYKQVGCYFVEWNARYFSSGIYFCTMYCDNYIRTIKLFLLK